MYSGEKAVKIMATPESQEVLLEKVRKRFAAAQEVGAIVKQLADAGHEVYLVGGCLRDLLLSKEPKDWDIATSAKPEEIQTLFPDSVYENDFGTVAVKTESEAPTLKIVEVTTFRLEGKYTDKRHPDEVTFATSIEEDLSRRDFTINAMALDVADEAKPRQNRSSSRRNESSRDRRGKQAKTLADPFGGLKDLKQGIIRAVGDAEERLEEDALRLMRVARFAAQLGFTIEKKTADAAAKKAGRLEFIAKERIQDELVKLLMTKNAADGIRYMQKLQLLRYVFPELEEGIDMAQNKHHKYTIFEHNVKSLEYAAGKDYSLVVRLASLLHDVGKSRVRVWKDDSRGERTRNGKKGDWTFYQHQYVGERMVVKMLDRFRFSRTIIERVALLVREHMFVYDPEIVTQRGVRRLVRRVGVDNVDDLIRVREADRIGSGVPKAQPYRLRHLQAMIEKAKHEPISPKKLIVKGDDVMELAGIDPTSSDAPKIGKILAVLLDEVIDDPEKNEKDVLRSRIKELGDLSDEELDALATRAKESLVEVQKRIDDEIKKRYFVK